MSTPAQKAANRQNAQHSTGPTTPAGKAKCSLNQLSHGFNQALCFLEDEDPQEFVGLHGDLTEEFQPATYCEQILVEKMCLNHWLSLRATRLQGLGLRCSLEQNAINTHLALLIRYQATADRAFFKARTELLTAQKERKKSEIGSESQMPQVEPTEAPCEPVEPPKIVPQPQPAPTFDAATPETLERVTEILAERLKISQKAA